MPVLFRRRERNPHLEFRDAVLAQRRQRFPGLTEAVLADAAVFARHRNERHEFRNALDGWLQALRLMWVTDAFFGLACYRLKAAAQARRLPLVPAVAHKMAMRNAQICIGNPVIVQPGVYVAHGQVVIDGMVEVGSGAVLFPWVTIGLKAGDPQGATIEPLATIGTGAKVIGPVTIGARSTVGANSVVVDDVPAGRTVAGSPARVVGGGAETSGNSAPPVSAAIEDLVGEAEQAASEGRYREAIVGLTRANRVDRHQWIDERLRDLRHLAVAEVADRPPRPEWPPPYPDPFPRSDTPPEIGPDQVDAEHIGGLLHHGCVIVRGLFSAEAAARMVDHIDRALTEYDALPNGMPDSDEGRWFRPFDPGPDSYSVHLLRRWTADRRGLWLPDSPPALFDVLESFGELGVIEAIEEYLGERPAMSLQKTTLRRVEPAERIASMHQDGAFLQGPVRTVNVWVALTACGGSDSDAPCLDIHPRRIDELLEPTGPPVPNAIPFETTQVLERAAPAQRPRFEAGDALIFDELFAHRTVFEPTMTVDRYALECWLFAPSAFPGDYIPFLC